MGHFFQKLRDRTRTSEPLITVRISKDALLHNLDVFKKITPEWVCAPVLKSNAYGHGLLDVATIVAKEGDVAFLIVDSYFEARVLRTAGIRTPLLVIGHTSTETVILDPFDDITFTVGTMTQIKEIADRPKADRPWAGKKPTTRLHLKIDTGMHRQGIMLEELSEAAVLALRYGLQIEGICSHLADSDGDDPAFTNEQIRRWNAAVKMWREQCPKTRWYHLAATSGMRFTKTIDANCFRLGLGLYGFEGSHTITGLRPALSLVTRITALRQVPAGEVVGYNGTFTTQRPTMIATIPAGYFEGVDRRLSNKGWVRIRGTDCPIIGRVSMNMTTIDVTDVSAVQEGDEVEIIGADAGAKNGVESIAALCTTVPHEILIHIPAHLKRVMV